MLWVILGVIGITVLIWLVLSIKILGPDEMAVFVFFGEPISFRNSGIQFVPFLPGLKCYLAKYPKKMYNFDYLSREAVSQAGVYGVSNEVSYGSQVLKVDSVAYLNFPREMRKKEDGEPVDDIKRDEEGRPVEPEKGTHPLIKILRSDIPIEKEKLKDWTEEAVVGAMRIAFGKMTWKQAIEDMGKVNEEVVKVFKDADGALIRAGFSQKGIRLVVTEIKLPKELEAALPGPDQERLKKDAADFVAKRQAVEWVGMVLESFALSKGKGLEDIQKEIEADKDFQREFLDYAKDMNIRMEGAERGAYLDIRVQGAEGLEQTFLNLLAAWKRMPAGCHPREKENSKEDEVKNTKDRLKEAVRKGDRKAWRETINQSQKRSSGSGAEGYSEEEEES